MLVAVLPKRKPTRSDCPVSIALEVIGDRWSLLIVRDMVVRGFSTFKQFQNSGERIATNILADRLLRLRRAGILTAERGAEDGRSVHYRLTQKGIDLAPTVLELLIWGARHEGSGERCAAIEQMERYRTAMLDEARRRWRERDPRPLQVNGRWMLDGIKTQQR